MAKSMRTSALSFYLSHLRLSWSMTTIYPSFALGLGSRLSPMTAYLLDRLAILVAVRRFPSMGAADSRSLRYDSYVRVQHFVRR
jgi:hypothetical protein